MVKRTASKRPGAIKVTAWAAALILLTTVFPLVWDSGWAGRGSPECEEAQRQLQEAKDQAERYKNEERAARTAHDAAFQNFLTARKNESDLGQLPPAYKSMIRRQLDEIIIIKSFTSHPTYDADLAAAESKLAELQQSLATSEENHAKAVADLEAAVQAEQDTAQNLRNKELLYFEWLGRQEEAQAEVDKVCKSDMDPNLLIFFGDIFETMLEEKPNDDSRKDEIKNQFLDQANESNREDLAIDEARRRGLDSGTGGGGGGGATTNASFNASCDINTGSGTNTVSVNGTPFCSVTGTAPTLSGGTANFTCVPGAAVTVSATCTATNCRVFSNAVANLTCPFTIPGFLSGGFGGAGGFATSASINCTCQ